MPGETQAEGLEQPRNESTVSAGAAADTPPGTTRTILLPSGREVALYNIDGEFFASENSCPHQGAPLAEGNLCGHVVECGLHGWQFDMRTGECLTVPERIVTYEVLVEDGLIKIVL